MDVRPGDHLSHYTRENYYAGKPNPEPPQSVYSTNLEQEQSLYSAYGKSKHNFQENVDFKLRSNNNDNYYMDTYEVNKKRANQNYSNLLGRKLGDPEHTPARDRDGMSARTNVMGMAIGEQPAKTHGGRQKQRGADRMDFIPTVHYTEFKDNRPENMGHKSNVSKQDDMRSRTDKMIQSLRGEIAPPE